MIKIEDVEQLIRDSRSSYFFRHSCATEQDKRELAQKIMSELIRPLTEIAHKNDVSVLTKPKHDGVQVELPFGTTVKGGAEFVESYYQTQHAIMEDYQ